MFRYENTNGGVFSTMVERWVPAHFVASDHIRCPIPEHHFADAGVRQHSVHDLSTTNDGAIYRYSNHTFEYHGGCLPNAFAVILGGPMVALVIVLLLLVCVVVAAAGGDAPRRARKLRAAIMEKIGEQRYESVEAFRQALGEYQRAMGAAGVKATPPTSATSSTWARSPRCSRRLPAGWQRRIREIDRGGGVCTEPPRTPPRRSASAVPRALRRRPVQDLRHRRRGWLRRRRPVVYYAPSPGRLPAPGSQRALEIGRQESERGRRAAAADAEASASGDNPVLYGNWRAYGVGLDAEDAALIGDAVFSEMRRGAER